SSLRQAMSPEPGNQRPHRLAGEVGNGSKTHDRTRPCPPTCQPERRRQMYPLPRATIWRLAAPTPALGTFSAYAWYQLATDKRARAPTFGAKLVYRAVAHHAELSAQQPSGNDYRGSTTADLGEFVGVALADLRPLRRLLRIGWLDGNSDGAYA